MPDRNLELALRIKADLEQAKAEVKRLETQVDSLGKTGKRTSDALGRVDAGKTAPAQAAAIGKVDAALGKTAVSADKAATSVKKADTAIDSLGATSKRTSTAVANLNLGGNLPAQVRQVSQVNDSLKRTALTAGELRNATRNLPAQITDIFVGLSTGQKPLQVLLQQGGQLKDLFGGIGPAVRAVGGYVLGLVNPYTLAAAAVAGVAIAYEKGAAEGRAFDNALILTGNSAGITSGQLSNLATQFDDLAGVSTRNAAAALAEIAATGRFTGDQIEQVSKAALQLQVATGASIQQTVQDFVKLKKDPVAAILELNETMHFLTQAELDNIVTLKEQGREQDAVTAAFRVYSDTINNRTSKVVENLGYIERAYRAIKQAAGEVVDSALGIGRDTTSIDLQKRIDGLQQYLKLNPRISQVERDIKNQQIAQAREGLVAFALKDNDALLAQGGTVDSAKATKAIKERQDAEKEFERIAVSNLDKRAKLEREIASIQEAGDKARLSQSVINVQIAAARARAAEAEAKNPKGPKAPKSEAQKDTEAGQRELENLRKQAALLGDLEEGEKRASEAARIRYEIEQGAYKNAEPALKAQLQAAAKALDSGRQQVEVAKQLVDVKLRTMQLQGTGDQAQLDKTTEALERLRQKLLAVGDAAGAAQVAKLMQLETAQTQVASIADQLETQRGQIGRDEQRVNIDQDAGLISKIEAQRRLLELRQREMSLLQQQIALTREAAAALDEGAPRRQELLDKADELTVRLQQLQAQGTLLETTLRNGFEEGLSNALIGLADGTLTLREALVGLIQDVVSSLAKLAAQQLASLATAKLFALLTKSSGSSDVGASAAKLDSAAVKTGLAGATLGLGAKFLGSSAQDLQRAADTLLLANLIGTASGFAEGGFTGYGGKYQVAGVVHRGEGVLNQREIGALGGPSGFYALRGAIADGSLSRFGDAPAAPVALASPRFSFADGGLATAGIPSPQLNLRIMNGFDFGGHAEEYFESPRGEKVLNNYITRNRGVVKAAIG